jgi:hypothetical protein
VHRYRSVNVTIRQRRPELLPVEAATQRLLKQHAHKGSQIIRSVVAKLPGRPVYLSRAAMGTRLGGFIYGTIVALAVLVAGAKAYPHDARYIAGLVAVTSLVFWLAHVYAHGLAESVAKDKHFSLADLRSLARREASIVEAALPPVAALLLGAVGLISTRSAVWLALGLGLAVLVVQGFVFARIERLGGPATLAVVAANLGLGVLLVGLKLLVSH